MEMGVRKAPFVRYEWGMTDFLCILNKNREDFLKTSAVSSSVKKANPAIKRDRHTDQEKLVV